MSVIGNLLPDSDDLFDVEIDDTRALADYAPLRYGIAPIFVFEPERVGYLSLGRQALVLTDDQQSLVTWIRKALATPRGVYPIYDDDYGTDLARCASYRELSSTVEDDLRRCLLLHPLITDVTDVSITPLDRDSAVLAFTVVDSISGDLQVTATI